MLPNNFNFYIGGRYDLKYFSDKNINYFIGFNHPAAPDNIFEFYTEDNTRDELGDFKDLCLFEYHDAYSESHKDMGLKMPDARLIKDIIYHGEVIKERLKQGEQINLLCGCAAGISRSTATAYIILCIILGEWHERDAWAYVLNKRDVARPNPLMVTLADNLLRRNFKMISPLKNCVDFNRRRGDADDSCLLF